MPDRSAVHVNAVRLKRVLIDIVGLSGAAAVVEGMREIYPPAAWIVVGVALFLCSWRIARVEFDIARAEAVTP